MSDRRRSTSLVCDDAAAVETPRRDEGFALVAVMLVLALLMTLGIGYFTLTHLEIRSTRAAMHGFRGLYAAEGGLEVRAETFRQTVDGFGTPSGAGPSSATPCAPGDLGSGDFACDQVTLEQRRVDTWARRAGGGQQWSLIPRGEAFQNLMADEQGWVVAARATAPDGRMEAELQMHLRQRRVPLYQFAAFWGKDLELVDPVTLAGPVHTTGDLFLGPAGGTLSINGAVSAEGSILRGRKDSNSCLGGTAEIPAPAVATALPACSATRLDYSPAALSGWGSMVQTGVDPATVPDAGSIAVGGVYWQRADLRVVLDINATPSIQIRQSGGTVDVTETAALLGCAATHHSTTFHNYREPSAATPMQLLDVDVTALLDCINGGGLGGGVALDDATDGGLIVHFSVDGPDSGTTNKYGVRLFNAAELASTDLSAPAIAGLTLASDQALYVQGHYNALNRKPAALVADSFNLLSENWSEPAYPATLASRPATATTLNAAIVAGSDSTGGADGAAGRDSGDYAGGLFGLVRLHEDWSGATLSYRGSFVSLFRPAHVVGSYGVGAPQFNPPSWSWTYETDFIDPTLLPPLTPRLSYVREQPTVASFPM